jgi:flagellin-like hook-associated protein FlgL
MSTPEDRLKTTRLRLQTQLEYIAFTLANATLSDEQKALLQSQLAAVQDELVRITGGVSLN